MSEHIAPISPSQTVNEVVARAWRVLDTVTDPEIPVVSLKELGVLRDIRQDSDGISVVITPTYSGCPAMHQMEEDIQAALVREGIAAKVVTQLAPVWTTDWITEAAKQKLLDYGIAPPHATLHGQSGENAGHAADGPRAGSAVPIRIKARRQSLHEVDSAPVVCPHCGSENTTETSHFGSTACKALYRCLDCREPFDYFKPF